MALSMCQNQLPQWLIQQAGGSLQHARTLMSLAANSLGELGTTSSSNSSEPVPSTASHGRSISTTRGIYMGRVFIRENLQKHPPESALFNRDNYQFLEKNGWSTTACKQVLRQHQHTQSAPQATLVFRQLSANIAAVESLRDLQALIVRHAHQMNAMNLVQCTQQATRLLSGRDGTPHYQEAALVLNTIAGHMQPQLNQLDGGPLCYVLASYVKCRCSPPADMLQELLQMLMVGGGQKMQQTHPHQLAQLLLALHKLVQPQAHWPIMKAILVQATALLRRQLQEPPLAGQQLLEHQQEEAPSSSSSSSGSGSSSSSSGGGGSSSFDAESVIGSDADGVSVTGKQRNDRGPAAPVKYNSDARRANRQRAMQQAWLLNQTKTFVSNTNSTALIALLLDKSNTFSQEYLRLFWQWLEGSQQLACLYPNAAVQLWQTVKSQWAKHEARTSANSPSPAEHHPAVAESNQDGDGSSSSSSSSSEAAASDLVEGDPAADAAVGGGSLDGADVPSAATAVSLADYQQRLFAYFGRAPLESLARVTTPLVSSMTEANLGQLLNSMGRMRYASPELLAAVAVALKALAAVQEPNLYTRAHAAYAAAQLQHYDPALLLPALLTAVQRPEEFNGFLAARVMIATSRLPQEVLQQLQVQLRQELHRQSGARGPPPAAVKPATAVADPATAAVRQVPDWVASLADSVAGRMGELRPREVAYILLSYSQMPGVPVHDRLFAAATEHIVAHAHTFTNSDDMDMVATAFEALEYKAGIPALKALQQQSEQLLAGGQ